MTGADSSDDYLSSESSLSRFLADFEAGVWPAANFHHAQHLAVAASYLIESSADPMERLRANIRSYNVSQGGANTEDRGYHETITRFWLEAVAGCMADLPPGLSRIDTVRHVVAEFAPRRDLFRDYYDFDVLNSRAARAEWIPPRRGIFPRS